MDALKMQLQPLKPEGARQAYGISPDTLIPRSISAELERNRFALLTALGQLSFEHQIDKEPNLSDDADLLAHYQSSNARLFAEVLAKNDEMQKWHDYYLGLSALPD